MAVGAWESIATDELYRGRSSRQHWFVQECVALAGLSPSAVCAVLGQVKAKALEWQAKVAAPS
jgi:hypothetical protein